MVSSVSGAVWSSVGQIAKIKLCSGQHIHLCSREHCGAYCQDLSMWMQRSQWCSREHCWGSWPRLRYVAVFAASGAVGSIVGADCQD